MPINKPTVKQQQVLDYLTKYQRLQGHAPTYREIGTALGLSVGTAQGYLYALESRGVLTLTAGESRSIQLTTKGKP